MRRQVRMASVDGRPSRRKNDRGSARGVHPLLDVDRQREEVEVLFFGALLAVVARQQHGLVVEVATTEPAACRASRPVSNGMVRVPKLPVVDGGGGLEDAFVDFSDRHGCPYSLSAANYSVWRRLE